MKILLINSVCGIRSTGRICTEIADKLSAEGHEVKIAYGREAVPEKYQKYAVRIGDDAMLKRHGIATRLLDKHGFSSEKETCEFLKWADEFAPDVVWLHNLHGYYINVELLFEWIKKHPDMQVKWTLHDCWAFTGHCAHFMIAKCDKWRTECGKCPQKREYPSSLLKDNSKDNFRRKKAAFTGIKNMELITPSKWLSGLVKESFLGEYSVNVIYNTIDTSVFKPTPSDFKQKHGIEDKFMILGVASAWSNEKGLCDFIKLSQMLDDGYAVVMVGLTAAQIKALPSNIIKIERTDSICELAEIYTAADVFFNPTYQDNYPTVDLEAEACGTDVIAYDVGGTSETIQRTGSMVIPAGDVEKFIQMIKTRKEIK